jgi:hypothetical protein
MKISKKCDESDNLNVEKISTKCNEDEKRIKCLSQKIDRLACKLKKPVVNFFTLTPTLFGGQYENLTAREPTVSVTRDFDGTVTMSLPFLLQFKNGGPNTSILALYGGPEFAKFLPRQPTLELFFLCHGLTLLGSDFQGVTMSLKVYNSSIETEGRLDLYLSTNFNGFVPDGTVYTLLPTAVTWTLYDQI